LAGDDWLKPTSLTCKEILQILETSPKDSTVQKHILWTCIIGMYLDRTQSAFVRCIIYQVHSCRPTSSAFLCLWWVVS